MKQQCWHFLYVLLLAFTATANEPAKPATGTLILSSEPGGAKVYLNGKLVGNTPIQAGKDWLLDVNEGEYKVEGMIDNGLPMKGSLNIYVSEGALQPVHILLSGGIEMVKIPGGCFLMGSSTNDPLHFASETPQHNVCVPAFEIGKYEVTFDEWDSCVAAGGCAYRPENVVWGRVFERGKHPVWRVSWHDIQQFLSWLSRTTGQNYRLPSESEWEYAARAGTTTAFTYGDSITPNLANYMETDKERKIYPVDSFPPNAWGLYNMHGNVHEVVADCYRPSYVGAPSNGDAVEEQGCSQRVLRGGSAVDEMRSLRSAHRYHSGADSRGNVTGFRLARTLP